MPVCLKTGSGRESLPLGRGSKPWLWGAWEPRTELHRLPADASATEWKKSVCREGPGVALRVSKGRGRCKQCAEGPPRAGAGGPGRGRGLAPGAGGAAPHHSPLRGKRARLQKPLVLGAVFWDCWTPSVRSPQGGAPAAGSY